MRILILGKNGQVGTELRRYFAEKTDVLALGREDDGGDLMQTAALVERLKTFRPDVVFNAAAYTAVDKAETERAVAYRINAETVGEIAHACAAIGAVLVHYSTDYVFDGNGADPRSETAETAPLNFYGVSKLAGETAIRASACRALIFRTSWVYAAHGHNFIKTMLRLAQTKMELNVVNDQTGAPTSAAFIADISAKLGCRVADGEMALCGLYNLVPNGETTWCGLAKYAIASVAKAGISQMLDPERINGIPSEAYPTPAKRPLNSRLSNEKLKNVYDGEIRDWSYYADDVLNQITK